MENNSELVVENLSKQLIEKIFVIGKKFLASEKIIALIWDENCEKYIPDSNEKILKGKVNEFIKKLFEQEGADSCIRDLYAKCCKNISFKRRLIKEIMEEIFSNIEVYEDSDFDNDRSIINTPDGIVDLKTGEYRKRTPKDLVLLETKANFIPGCRILPKTIEDFLSFYLSNPELSKDENAERLESYLQILGASLTGILKKFIAEFGPTNNGKTTKQKFLLHVLNDYAGSVDARSIAKRPRSNDQIRPEIIDMRKQRITQVAETENDDVYDGAKIKSLSGKDEQILRKPHAKNSIRFRYYGVITIAGNYLPRISNLEDNAFLNRMIVIQSKQSVKDENIDAELFDKLCSHSDKFFSVICHKAMDFFSNSKELLIAESFKADKQKLILNQRDPVAMFFEQKVQVIENGPTIRSFMDKWSPVWLYSKCFLPFLAEIGFKQKIGPNLFYQKFKELAESFPEIIKHKGGSRSYYSGIDLPGYPKDSTFLSDIATAQADDIIKDECNKNVKNFVFLMALKKNSLIE